MSLTYKKIFDNSLSLPHNKLICIGKSSLGKKIFALHFGSFESKQYLISCSIHAREYITTLLLNELIMNNIANINGLWYIPMCNPDGVKISLENKVPQRYISLFQNYSNAELKLWKANARGVDLNVNFNSNWGKGKHNVGVRGSENYIGKNPNSERETQCLCEFLLKINPELNICFHSKGEVVYYGHKIDKLKKADSIFFCKNLAKCIHYKPVKTKASFGGFADYSSDKLGIKSATIEIGNNNLQHPIGEKNLKDILKNFINFFTFINNYLRY